MWTVHHGDSSQINFLPRNQLLYWWKSSVTFSVHPAWLSWKKRWDGINGRYRKPQATRAPSPVTCSLLCCSDLNPAVQIKSDNPTSHCILINNHVSANVLLTRYGGSFWLWRNVVRCSYYITTWDQDALLWNYFSCTLVLLCVLMRFFVCVYIFCKPNFVSSCNWYRPPIDVYCSTSTSRLSDRNPAEAL